MELELENKFKKHPFYTLFEGEDGVYELELDEVTHVSVQIISAILKDIFDIPINKEIETIFEMLK